jgi:hypothetical protein
MPYLQNLFCMFEVNCVVIDGNKVIRGGDGGVVEDVVKSRSIILNHMRL